MQLNEAIELIKHPFFSTGKQVWADLGCGSGLFTHALASLLLPGSKIIAVDKSMREFQMPLETNSITIEKLETDFVKNNLAVKNLDGLLMANAFHFVRDKDAFLRKVETYFLNAGNFLMVEYDTNTANTWVPYPINFVSLQEFFTTRGYTRIEKLHELPSRYRQANIYSAFVTK